MASRRLHAGGLLPSGLTRRLACHPVLHSHHASASHFLAASIWLASKYWIFAIVNGLQTLAIHFSQVLSTTSAMRSILVQCVVENFMSFHRACRSQHWKSSKCART